jgi:hypothetical protein
MPYIKESNRVVYKEILKDLAGKIQVMAHECGHDKIAGELNFIITKLLKEVYKGKLNYAAHNEIIGMLECCKQEWYRRFAAPYEDLKILENGDVEP